MNAATIKERLSRVWTYRWSVTLDRLRYDVRLECRWQSNTFVIESGGEPLACDVLNFHAEPFRLQEVEVNAATGDLLTFRTGPRNLYSYGLEVARDGAVVYRSHPEPFAALKGIQKIASFGSSVEGKLQAERGKEFYPAIAADIGVSVLLYVAAGYMSLRDVAILGASAVLLLMLADWIAGRVFARKLNLSGGLSALGVLVLLLSAGFAWLVENELAIMLKSSILGLLAAALLATDAMLGGKYIGQRTSRYVTFMELDPRRFSWGSAMAAAGQSLLSAAIAIWLSRDTWLFYRHWVGPTLGIVLGALVLWKSRRQGV